MCILLGFVILGSTYFFQTFEYQQRDWNLITINAVAIGCGFAGTQISNGIAFRIQYIVCLFAAIVFGTTVGAVFMAQITRPILRHQIDSIHEIVDGKFSLAGDPFAFTKILQQNEVIILQ